MTAFIAGTPSAQGEKTEDLAGVLKIAIIVFGVVAVVIPTEIFIYKLVLLKKSGKMEEDKKE